MKPYDQPPDLGGSFQQAHADRPELQASSDHHLSEIGLDRSQVVSTVEKIIETGGQPA